jgi:hypothetical protein
LNLITFETTQVTLAETSLSDVAIEDTAIVSRVASPVPDVAKGTPFDIRQVLTGDTGAWLARVVIGTEDRGLLLTLGTFRGTGGALTFGELRMALDKGLVEGRHDVLLLDGSLVLLGSESTVRQADEGTGSIGVGAGQERAERRSGD